MTRVEFEQQVRLNQEPLRRFLINLCSGDSSLSDDIAQEAFIKAYLNLNSFSGKSKFSTWLFRIAYNCFCDNKRASSRFNTVELNDTKHFANESTDSKYMNQELYMALSKLNENERSCILLFYMEDKSIKDISEITAIKENTIKSHLSRAKTNISQHLKSIGYER
ncbi:MAG: RNA polymerase subunit sigma-70 [Bacteroidetes bacterium HGW-Bacteroidetes-8]|jgi:RNA polymerase sigma-70 factor (ECF subfamily)|nr:MAG: RNA polymerase subunit sigma-70 [Bacteroidetes bacterium HGW-Bacteroidetes-8]